MSSRLLQLSVLALATTTAVGATETEVRPEIEAAVPGFQQILPRGGIPALVDPEFVSVAEAEVPDGAWMMGFEIDGRAFAYDLNLLNRHEVVNHRAGERPIAAVW